MPKKNSRPLRVFLSYASEDMEKASMLCQELTNEGMDVWWDKEKLLPGQEWKLQIAEAIENSDAILICLSDASIRKEGYVQKEIRDALVKAEEKPEGTIFVIPVRWDNCKVPHSLVRFQYVDLFDKPGYQRLFKALEFRATSLGLSLAERKIIQKPQPDNSYELHNLLNNMLRDDEGLQESLAHLKNREPDDKGWFHREIRSGLLKMMSDQNQQVKTRARAGEVLSWVGDPRFRPDAWNLPDDDRLGFVEIPDGHFQMGISQIDKVQDNHRESPLHTVDLPFCYINRFPVTVSQFSSFLMETNPGKRMATETRSLGNHPVVSVSWFEAIRYCQWLTEKLRQWLETPKDIAQKLRNLSWVVTLPSEAEWEKAARGGSDARNYPWGAMVDPGRANYGATKLERTSTVGCFEDGKSPYGLYDMCGNVWEWTRSNWGTSPDKPQYRYPYVSHDKREDMQASEGMLKVIRGGSCHSPLEDIRCYRRGADFPMARREHIGFRLAITLLEQQGVKSGNAI